MQNRSNRNADGVPIRTTLVGLLLILLPAALLAWLAGNPRLDREILLVSEHFMMVSVISLLALGVSLMVARGARQQSQFQVLLMSLGFMCVAGFFTVHALATPGMLLDAPAPIVSVEPSAPVDRYAGSFGNRYGSPASSTPSSPSETATGTSYDYDGTIIGLSSTLSLFVPALFFFASHAPVERRIRALLPLSGGTMVALVVAGLLGYGYLAGWHTEWLSGLAIARAPVSYWLAGITVLLLLFTAWQQARIHLRTRFPMQAALAVAFVLLAEAQVVMVASAFWSISWWVYHLLMLLAVVLALGALFLELDRRRGLERFLPNEVVERIVSGDLVRLNGERRTVTVLFADLRNSTTLAEKMAADEVVDMLNDYVGCMARAVFAHGGMVDKYLGDGLMAVFGVVPDASDGAVGAVRAARAMEDEIGAVNRRRVADGGSAIGFGVGMHTGEVVLGTVGTAQRQDFTAVGDAVNTAARIEALSKEYDSPIVYSGQTAQRLDTGGIRSRPLGSAPIRGRSEPIELFAPES